MTCTVITDGGRREEEGGWSPGLRQEGQQEGQGQGQGSSPPEASTESVFSIL